jgi:hypothetical protein
MKTHNNNNNKCCAKGSGKEVEIQEFMYRDTMNVEPEMYDYTNSIWIHWNSNEKLNHLTPNGHFSGRTAPLTYICSIFLFIQQLYVLNILNMLHTLRFFLFKMPFIS